MNWWPKWPKWPKWTGGRSGRNGLVTEAAELWARQQSLLGPNFPAEVRQYLSCFSSMPQFQLTILQLLFGPLSSKETGMAAIADRSRFQQSDAKGTAFILL